MRVYDARVHISIFIRIFKFADIYTSHGAMIDTISHARKNPMRIFFFIFSYMEGKRISMESGTFVKCVYLRKY